MKILPRLLWGCVLAVIVYVAALAYLSPETSTYTSNADVPTRPTTTHRFTPTTTTTRPPVTSAPTDDLVVIDGAHVYRLPRTQAVALYLWLAINQETPPR